MRGGLIAAPRTVQVDYRRVVDDTESGHIAWPDIQAALRRCRSVEEYLLLLDELSMILRYLSELFAHTSFYPARIAHPCGEGEPGEAIEPQEVR